MNKELAVYSGVLITLAIIFVLILTLSINAVAAYALFWAANTLGLATIEPNTTNLIAGAIILTILSSIFGGSSYNRGD